ncbi:MAG: hypothetical protein A2089_03710 [Elusimicrobia bacterium GWD2_63_28]|nr:MAG: hypothetical protein A2089_03710 [Elusimicrobia bacterium GWD2_63_28]
MKNIFTKIVKYLMGNFTHTAPAPVPPSAPPATGIPISSTEGFGTRVYHDQPAVIGPQGIPEKVEVAQETKNGPRYFVKRYFPMTSFGEHTSLDGIHGQCQHPGCEGFGLKGRMDYCAMEGCKKLFCAAHLRLLGGNLYCLSCLPRAVDEFNTWQSAAETPKEKGERQ